MTARELIKLRVLETSPVTAKEACEELSGRLGADPVQVVGRVLVLYRENPEIKAYTEELSKL